MTDLRNLYQDVILDHNETPRNFGRVSDANREATGDNPLCGDQYDVTVRVEDGVIEEIAFEGEGCAISKAAASMMTQHVEGETIEEVEALISGFRRMLTGEPEEGDEDLLGHLRVFESVGSRPERVKCAVLAWHTLDAALSGREEITTEGDDDPIPEE
ncbi:MAG: Fe-S cluster assembly sulfur transfer protein SufU [Bradymonadaceae bacterium]